MIGFDSRRRLLPLLLSPLVACAATAPCPQTAPPATGTPAPASSAAALVPVAPAAPPSAAPASPATDDAYKRPADDFVRFADAPTPPRVVESPDFRAAVVYQVVQLLPIAELSQPELKLAGLRFNPENRSQTRAGYTTSLSFVDLDTGDSRPVRGLPDGAHLRQIAWSPDGKWVSFTVTTPTRVELWLASRADAAAHRVGEVVLNAIYPVPACHWVSTSAALVCRTVPRTAPGLPERSRTPAGPVIDENAGKKRPAPTYQDLLKDEVDAAQFESLLESEIARVGLDGTSTVLGSKAPYLVADPSPNGAHVLVESVHRPFSYHVPVYRFPLRSEVWSLDGKVEAPIADLPLANEVPIDFDAVRTGRREIEWRPDLPDSLYWIEARDGGDPKADATVRDELFTLAAPFTAQPSRLIGLSLRYHDAFFASAHLAIVHERWWKNRHENEWQIAPGAPAQAPRKIGDRAYEDRYADPGELQTRRTPLGTRVLWTDASETHVVRFGEGASPDGDRPFVDTQDLSSLKATRAWRSEAPYYEAPESLAPDGTKALAIRESNTEPPNVFLRDLRAGTSKPITRFVNPYPELTGAKREIIRYKRADGVPLSGTLYTPPGYDGKTPLPVLMWAYPQEFKSAKSAGEVHGSPYRFPEIWWGSPLYWLARGYAVLDDPAFPIVGEGKKQPNDTYVKQLVGDASAAIDELVRRGVGDRDRMAIGGHSYGAFTTANLLAHSRLFRAGVARSGAYNRTLTPFGFQAEERSFWEATPTYVEMSPFTHAQDIQDPLLLIHGMEDNNQGTFPLQSERMFAALQGLGKTARLVLLPKEAHGYRARESVLHMLWEMDTWLDKYVKSAGPRAAAKR
jgi:dipeptidyl aminopeptidase/acylaminoacyl peptidase